jgi:hypothetical protein
LEDTLFRRLEEMRKKPPGELFELLERTLEVLRATKEALLEQRREIRTLATAVDSLRSRVDQLVLSRSEAPRYVEPEAQQPEPQPELEPEPAPELPPVADAEPVDEYRHEDEYEEPSPAVEQAYETVADETVVEEPVPEAPAAEAVPEPEAEQEPEPEAPLEHVLMLTTAAGYRLVTGDGADPESSVEIDGTTYLVGQRVRSPFPGDERPAYVAVAAVAADDEY